MSGNPFAILDDASTSRDSWRLPTFERGSERVRLEGGERATHAIGGCTLEISSRGRGTPWETAWKSERPGTLTVTQRRVVFGCRRYESGSAWGGFGLGGVVVGLALTAASKGLAKARSAGNCFGAQARYECVAAVAFSRPGDGEIGCVHVDLADGDRRWRFSLWSAAGTGTTPEVAEAIVAGAVAVRVAAGESLTPEQVAELESLGTPQLRPARGLTSAIDLPGARSLSEPLPMAAPDPRARLRFN